LPSLRASSAGIVQLSVPVIAALGGIVLLAEPVGWRFALAAALTLGGIGLATLKAR
jgi:drug/metabolite transporter (DMT)-like permease